MNKDLKITGIDDQDGNMHEKDVFSIRARFLIKQFLPEATEAELDQFSAAFLEYVSGISVEEIRAKLQSFDGNYQTLFNYYLWTFLVPSMATSEFHLEDLEEIDPYYTKFWEELLSEGRDAMADEA